MRLSAEGVEGQLIYTGKDATFYSDDNGNRLDHSPATLGVDDDQA